MRMKTSGAGEEEVRSRATKREEERTYNQRAARRERATSGGDPLSADQFEKPARAGFFPL